MITFSITTAHHEYTENSELKILQLFDHFLIVYDKLYRVITPSVGMLIVIWLIVGMPSVVTVSIIAEFHYADFSYAKCCYAESRDPGRCNDDFHYADFWCTELCHAECPFAQIHYAECLMLSIIILNVLLSCFLWLESIICY